MAPLTRASVNRTEGAKKPAAEMHRSPEQSWELATPETGRNGRAVSETRSFNGSLQEGSYQEDESMGFDEGGSDENMPPKTLSADDHEDILHPLREAASRVGREVEHFAAVLDRFNPLKAINKAETRAMAFELLDEYQSISTKTVQRLRDRHQSSKKSRSRFRGFQLDNEIEEVDMDREELSHGETTPEDLERWEQEANTWDLLRRLANLRFRKERQKPPRLNRFSSERDYWKAFLNTNDSAAERATVLGWLKNIAEDDGEDIDDLVEDLKNQANRGELNHNGWLYTKLRIKEMKRIASVDTALDRNRFALKDLHVVSHTTDMLITQLDPDALCRQKLRLEPEDTYFERAMWLACYEMLRRGTSREKIREWCEEQAEIWRAVSMGGLPDFSEDGPGEPTNQTSLSLWRRMCYKIATSPGVDTYEKAVYGILSGDLASVEAVSKTWDDLMFAHYNSLVTSQFEQFVQDVNPERPNFKPFHDYKQLHGDPMNLIQRLKAHPKASREANQPMKMIQGILIADEFSIFIEEQGLMLSHVANEGKNSVLFPKPKPHAYMHANKPEDYISTNDHDSLRVLTHILLAFKSLGLDMGDQGRLTAIENVIVAYIQFLRLAGMEELIPTYASQLSEDRMYAVLGRSLIDVLQPESRETLIRLMKDLGIDVQRFVKWQTHCLMVDYYVPETGYPALESLRMRALIPGRGERKRVVPGFTRCTIDRIYLLLVRSLEWYLLVDGLWVETFQAGAELYKLFFRIGNLSAAILLAESVPSNVIAQSKSQLLCGESVDFETLESYLEKDIFPEEFEQEGELADAPMRRSVCQYMLDSARCFRELEMLERALDVIDELAITVEEIDKTPHSKTKENAPNARQAVFPLYTRLCTTVEALLHGWLLKAQESDPKQLQKLRLAYLPDLILGYNQMLDFCGHLLSRNALLRSMDLATIIADDENQLAQLFVESGKIDELVQDFASNSQKLLTRRETGTAKATGMEAKRMRQEQGMNIDIWSVDFERRRGIDADE